MDNEPDFLYRAFEEEIHAIEFLERGKFRLGLLDVYKTIEEKHRRDQTEGTSNTYIETDFPDILCELGGVDIMPKYLMCTSSSKAEGSYIRENFGKYIVKINEPMIFLNDIFNSRPCNSEMTFVGKPKFKEVRYSKGQIQNIDPESMEAITLTYTQKPPSFKNDCEYRYIVTALPCIKTKPEKYINYELNRRLNYLEIVL